MDLYQLEVLITVAQEQSFSRAAERIGRTQPAVSQAVRKLEDELGEVLFDRSSKDGTLTACGQVLYEYALLMLNLRQEAESAVREVKDLQRGKLVIGANEYGVTYLLPGITTFRRQYSQIKVEVRRSLASRIPSLVVSREVELGVVSYRPTDSALIVLPAATDETALIVHPKHPLAQCDVVSVSDLGEESFIAQSVTSPYRERVKQMFLKSHTPMKISIELPTLEAIKRAVELGMGMAFIPRLTAETEIERGRLKALRVREMHLARRLYLLHRRGAKLSHAAHAFLKVISESARASTPRNGP